MMRENFSETLNYILNVFILSNTIFVCDKNINSFTHSQFPIEKQLRMNSLSLTLPQQLISVQASEPIISAHQQHRSLALSNKKRYTGCPVYLFYML